DAPYYVGKTTDADRRYQAHLDSPLPTTRRLLAEGKKPVMRVLGCYSEIWTSFCEQAWINRLLSQGAQLENAALPSSDIRFAGDDDSQIIIAGVVRSPERISLD